VVSPVALVLGDLFTEGKIVSKSWHINLCFEEMNMHMLRDVVDRFLLLGRRLLELKELLFLKLTDGVIFNGALSSPECVAKHRKEQV
jgi:hypothetical protein